MYKPVGLNSYVGNIKQNKNVGLQFHSMCIGTWDGHLLKAPPVTQMHV